MPSTFTWWAITGVNSDRVESSAARWNTRSISNSARMRSSSAVSRMDPVNSRVTIFPMSGSRRVRSSVTMRWRPEAASRVIRP